MLNIIADSVSELTDRYVESYEVETLLKRIEELGMLPPLFNKQDGNSAAIEDYFWDSEDEST